MNGHFTHRAATRMTVALGIVLVMAPEFGATRSALANGSSNNCKDAFAAGYAVRHMEMGGGIMLRGDGSFRYQMSYGALDEEAQGRWTCDNTAVFLTSNPVVPPRFVMLGADLAPQGKLDITLELPDGMSRQYFSVMIRRADGSTEQRQFDEDGLTLASEPRARPLEIVPLLPVYGVVGDPITLPGKEGLRVRLRFLPNDLGQVAFSHTRLEKEAGGLSLQRFGETILLQRSSAVLMRK